MQVATYDAALRFLHGASDSAAINRVLTVAQRLTRCSMVAVMAVEGDDVRVIASLNIPFALAQTKIKKNEAVAKAFSKPQIIDNFDSRKFTKAHPILDASMGVKYLISTPIPLKRLTHQVVLVCLDTSNTQRRPADLLRWLGTIAEIFADEIILIGELALLAEKEMLNLKITRQHSIDAVSNSDSPCAIIDSQMNIYAVSKPLCAILGFSEAEILEKSPKEIIPRSFDSIEHYIQRMSKDINDNSNLTFYNPAGTNKYTLSTIKFSVKNKSEFFLLLSLHRVDEIGPYSQNIVRDAIYENESVTSEFLLKTLIKKQRLLHRGTTAYHAVFRWRQGVKEAQIAALRALKRNPPVPFVDTIAREMVIAAEMLFGRNTFSAVTHVPCGHSGENCLAALIAKRVAELLNLDFRPAFETLSVKGSSHPLGNVKRPAMRVIDAIDCPVLLIDDVATSGSHIDEAAKKLKKTAPAVLPLVWIAD